MRGKNTRVAQRVRALRRSATDAERKLWLQLRSRALEGHKFIRQHPIGPYVVDFACREHRLIIEIDGGQHATSPKDAARTRYLSSRGYLVLRYWNNEVIENLSGVLEHIVSELRRRPAANDIG